APTVTPLHGNPDPVASLLVQSADDLAVGRRQHVDARALGSAAATDADLTRRCAIAVQRLVHLLRREEKIGTAVGGHEEPVSVGMPLDRARDEIELGDDAKLTFAIGHELAVA